MAAVVPMRGRGEDERPLPHNLEAERSVLGAVLLADQAFALASAVIVSADFFRDAHRRIFSAMGRLAARGVAIDLTTLRDELGRSGELDEVGGPAYIATLVDGVPRSMNVEHYARIVKGKAVLRTLIYSANKILSTAYDGADDTGAIVAQAEDAILSVANARGASVSMGFPAIETLRHRLAQPRQPVEYVIGSWQPDGSRAMLAAQFKSGKTTVSGNVIRPLVDGGLFLERYPVTPITGAVVVLDFEMSPLQLDGWLGAQHIRNDDRVVVVSLRGAASRFDILRDRTRAEWARRLRDVDAGYLVWDCVRPLMDALGLDEHREAGRLLVAFDELLAEAGIKNALVVHHMGHGGERSRGDSRLRDWPDVEWRLVRKTEDPASPRFLSAYGRDVDVPECELEFDPASRHLSIVGGSRRDAAVAGALEAVISTLRGGQGELSGRAIKAALADSEHARDTIEAALVFGIQAGALTVGRGDRGAKLYRPSDRPTVSGHCPADTPNECPAAYIKPDTQDTQRERSTVRAFGRSEQGGADVGRL